MVVRPTKLRLRKELFVLAAKAIDYTNKNIRIMITRLWIVCELVLLRFLATLDWLTYVFIIIRFKPSSIFPFHKQTGIEIELIKILKGNI